MPTKKRQPVVKFQSNDFGGFTDPEFGKGPQAGLGILERIEQRLAAIEQKLGALIVQQRIEGFERRLSALEAEKEPATKGTGGS